MKVTVSGPLLSIGFPVYNGEDSVAAALDSILSQDFTDYEIVIADNASTDRTREICEYYAERDSRIRYSRNSENIGVNPNHDHVFQLSRGEYFTWFAGDLRYFPGMLRRCFEALQGGPSVVLVYPRCELLCDGQMLPQGSQPSIACKDSRAWRRLHAVIRNIRFVNQLFGIMRRDALSKTRLNESYASSDYVLLAELSMLGEIQELPEVLFSRRVDSNRGTAAVIGDRDRWIEWIDPRAQRRWRDCLPHRERLALEYFSSACQSSLPWAAKLPCLFVAGGTGYWELFLTKSGPLRRRIPGLSRTGRL